MIVFDWIAIITATSLWAVAVLSPGPAMAGITHWALTAERTSALAFILGVTVGSLIYGSLTLFGLVAVMAKLVGLSDVVLWLGAGYLLWLGISAWFIEAKPGGEKEPASPKSAKAFKRGLLLELTNPKGIAFFVSVFAVSVPPEASLATKITVLCIGTLVELLWYTMLGLTLGRNCVRRVFLRGKSWLNRFFGATYICFAVALLLSQQSG